MQTPHSRFSTPQWCRQEDSLTVIMRAISRVSVFLYSVDYVSATSVLAKLCTDHLLLITSEQKAILVNLVCAYLYLENESEPPFRYNTIKRSSEGSAKRMNIIMAFNLQYEGHTIDLEEFLRQDIASDVKERAWDENNVTVCFLSISMHFSIK